MGMGVRSYGQLGNGTEDSRPMPGYISGSNRMPIINNHDTYTNSTSVTLISAIADETSGVAFMQFSNDGTTWSASMPYAISAY
jgi:hypothetical protein